MVYSVSKKRIKITLSILLIASLLFPLMPSIKNADELEPSPVYDSIQPGMTWTDTDGKLIEAHGGSVQKLNEAEINFDVDGNGELTKDFWFWYGEEKTSATRPVEGVKVYISEDLYNWKDMGVVLPTHDKLPVKLNSNEDGLEYDATSLAELKEWGNLTEPTEDVTESQITMAKNFLEAYVTKWGDKENKIAEEYDDAKLRLAFENLYGRYNIVERPKMLYNKQIGKFVIAFHSDGPTYETEALVNWVKRGGNPDDYDTGSRYGKAQMGFAVSDTPFGPFKLVNATRMNWTEGVTPSHRLGEARDFTVYVDEEKDVNNDGVDDAYAVYSSEMNAEMYVSLLNAEYTAPAVDGGDAEPGVDYNYRALPDQHREASSVFYYDGYYYMLTSGTNGWGSSEVIYYRSKSMILPVGDIWERVGDPFAEAGTRGYDSQPTFIIDVDAEKGQFIYMGDRWRVSDNGSAGPDSRYVWLPIQIGNNNTINIEYYDSWKPTNEWLYKTLVINTEIPETVMIGEEPALPNTVNVTTTNETFNTPVTWSYNADEFNQEGTVIVEATFPELKNRTRQLEVQVVPPVNLGELELNTDVVLYGNQFSIATTVNNILDLKQEVTISADGPSDWSSVPVTVQLDSLESKEVTIPVSPPEVGEPGIFHLDVSASLDNKVSEKEVEVLAVPKAKDLVYGLDAGTGNSTVFEKYDRLSPNETWDEDKGFGWIGNTPDSRDRGAVDALRKDLIASSRPATLGLSIPSGYHTIYVQSGDRQYSQSNTIINFDGRKVAETNGTSAGEFKFMSFTVNGGETGKPIELEFSGVSGNHWVINSVMVQKGIPTTVDEMVSLIEQYKTDGEFKNNGAAQSLLAQLDTVNHFEQSGEMKKTKHHMNNFIQLLENHKEQNLISEKAFGILNANGKYLLEKWN